MKPDDIKPGVYEVDDPYDMTPGPIHWICVIFVVIALGLIGYFLDGRT